MISLDFAGIELKLKKDDLHTRVFDPVRKRWFVLTPEEHVRQYIIQYMIQTAGYPAAMIAVEKQVKVNNRIKRFDIVVYDHTHSPWLLAECKAPAIGITDHTLHQLLSYHHTVQCSYWVLSNGHSTFCADARNTADIHWMEQLPAYQG